MTSEFENKIADYMKELCSQNPDPSHDFLHVERVVRMAKKLAAIEGAKLEIVIPAAYLHDCVYIAKSDARRALASQLSAEKAIELLSTWGYSEKYFDDIFHAIQRHSFSANVSVESIEAKVVQDADRLDAIGAVGIMRCFSLSGLMSRPFYQSLDPFCSDRVPDDQNFTLDHFYKKLLLIPAKLHTKSAQAVAAKRLEMMNHFLDALKIEITG